MSYRALAGTDLNTHHRFLREAETLRFDFIQGLNKAHIEKLSYADDLARNKDEASGKKARVSSENWQILQEFSFKPDSAAKGFEWKWYYAFQQVGDQKAEALSQDYRDRRLNEMN